MDETLPDSKAITVTAEERSKAFPVAVITHFVVQLSDKRLDSIIQSVPFWVFIGKTRSKALFDDEEQLEWLNAVRVRTRESIAFTNTQINRFCNQNIDEAKLRIVEIDFSKPQPGENLKLFWKPAREIIY
ncbi:hypothetical protein BDV24DRAFT_152810 [Aspergillus arachidicola]|uniref:Uncharacterized protein n=1 Tax=Aspergillus arachidicola TaxID=656916 RepID=A0A5N6Y6W0_9EURO|nr:hypothetical protein BDV24DRAFT_152810 [Aspergillus arachidicola]